MLESLRLFFSKKRVIFSLAIISFAAGFLLSQYLLNGVPVLVNLGIGVFGGILATLLVQWATKLFGEDRFEIRTIGPNIFVNGVVPVSTTSISLLHDFQKKYLEQKTGQSS